MPYVTLTTESGHTWETSLAENITQKQAEDYFLGQYFNVDAYPVETMERVVNVEYYCSDKVAV